ncbi:MAG: SH3 domain-containing protein [Candidatus Omnitrophica bacterium]|nr:SH3 domain-containing protein [Candidatus Omnitrophota bacterium]
MRLVKFSLTTLILIIVTSGCATTERLQYAAPSVLPNTTSDMKTAGFWVSLHPSPDKLVLDAEGVKTFNRRIMDALDTVKELTVYRPDYSRSNLADTAKDTLKHLKKDKLHTKTGQPAGRSWYDPIEKNMDLDLSSEDPPLREAGAIIRYGFTEKRTEQRVLPTDEILTAKKFDIDFDKLQNSSLDPGSPVLIFHQSLDKEWLYSATSTSEGWVKAKDVAECPEDVFLKFLDRSPFIIVTAPKSEIFLDEGRTRYYDYARMGARFPFTGKINDETVGILIPSSDAVDGSLIRQAYMSSALVHQGYLPYTPRTILEQAFKYLNAPYGWGGMYGEQDCSSFIRSIFAAVGVQLPRNSGAQGQAGKLLGTFTERNDLKNKTDILVRDASGGITTLQLKGHVMLYLGTYGCRQYAIHETHGYSEGDPFPLKDTSRIINRVAVTDLTLGEGSKKGSHIKRVLNIRAIQ